MKKQEKMTESGFERHFLGCLRMKKARAFKWVCPGVSGIPDRICVFPGGRIVFAELKRPGRKDGLSARQKYVFGILEKLGCDVRRIGSKEDIEKLMEDMGRDI